MQRQAVGGGGGGGAGKSGAMTLSPHSSSSSSSPTSSPHPSLSTEASSEASDSELLFALLQKKRFDELDLQLKKSWTKKKKTTIASSSSMSRSSSSSNVEVAIDDPRDAFGNTLLLGACQLGSRKAVKWCLAQGADSNAANRFGNTCLHFCVEFKVDPSIGRHLRKKHGASVAATNARGLTCFQRIADSNSNSVNSSSSDGDRDNNEE
jgi:ankyrin repeat protein